MKRIKVPEEIIEMLSFVEAEDFSFNCATDRIATFIEQGKTRLRII